MSFIDAVKIDKTAVSDMHKDTNPLHHKKRVMDNGHKKNELNIRIDIRYLLRYIKKGISLT